MLLTHRTDPIPKTSIIKKSLEYLKLEWQSVSDGEAHHLEHATVSHELQEDEREEADLRSVHIRNQDLFYTPRHTPIFGHIIAQLTSTHLHARRYQQDSHPQDSKHADRGQRPHIMSHTKITASTSLNACASTVYSARLSEPVR